MNKEITIIRQAGGYCVVLREVAQCLRKDTEALGLYAFLLSLPDGWEFKKSWLKNETGMGINKLNRLLKFLKDHKLINTIQRKEKGKFAEFEMEIYDGKKFERNEDLTPLFNSPSHRNRSTVSVVTETEHKITNTKRININKESKSPLPVNKIDNQKMQTIREAYPLKFEPSLSNVELIEKRRLDHETVITKFVAHVVATGWKRCNWQAALAKWILDEKIPFSAKPNQVHPHQTQSTVKFWEAGNPDYDRQHA